MSNKCKLEFEGFEDVIDKLAKVNANIKKIAEKSLIESHKLITKKGR